MSCALEHVAAASERPEHGREGAGAWLCAWSPALGINPHDDVVIGARLKLLLEEKIRGRTCGGV